MPLQTRASCFSQLGATPPWPGLQDSASWAPPRTLPATRLPPPRSVKFPLNLPKPTTSARPYTSAPGQAGISPATHTPQGTCCSFPGALLEPLLTSRQPHPCTAALIVCLPPLRSYHSPIRTLGRSSLPSGGHSSAWPIPRSPPCAFLPLSAPALCSPDSCPQLNRARTTVVHTLQLGLLEQGCLFYFSLHSRGGDTCLAWHAQPSPIPGIQWCLINIGK